MERSTYFAYAIAAVVLVGAIIFGRGGTRADASAPTTVTWLLSHQPTDVFANATKVFAETLSKESGGDLSLKVITPEDLGYAMGDVPNDAIFNALNSGKAQIASAYTVALGAQDPAMWAVTMPFLFTDYASTNAALDSSAAAQILSTFTGAHALAFTMSGGYRIIATKDKPVTTLADLKGLKIATSGGPVAAATLSALGAIPVSVDLESGTGKIDPATIDGVETTYSRLGEAVGLESPYTRYLNETNHSMFLTAILAGNNFYQTLSPKDQRALRDAAIAAAETERRDSIALGEKVRDELAKQGSIVSTLSPDARASFERATASVYNSYASKIGASFIRELETAQ